MVDEVVLDFETKSRLSLPHVGTERYLADDAADIVCLAYKINREPTKLWIPGCDVAPFNPYDFDRIYAFNAYYDFRVWNYLGVNKYGWNSWPIERTIDVMALCGRYTFPQSLEAAGKALKLKTQKDNKGKALMKKISCPPFKFTRQELIDYYKYCITDVDTLREMIDALPADHLSEREQEIWLETMQLNHKGLPIDHVSVKRINKVVKYYKQEQAKFLSDLTDDELTSPSQTVAMANWVTEQGVHCSNVQADTVSDLLKQPDLPHQVRSVLEIRQECGQSSVAKYEKLEMMVHNGTIYDNLRYYGTSTGRWSGLGFQAHNLPRATVDNPEDTIDSFHDASVLRHGDVIDKAKALIRSMIEAEDGYILAVADYSAIENRMLMWMVGEERALELLASGRCMYRDMAARLFNKPYEDVTDAERFVGKTIILGCGYGLGWRGYIAYAGGYGLDIQPTQAKEAIGTYRGTYINVPKYWKGVTLAAHRALRNPGEEFRYKGVAFKYVKDRNGLPWLKLTLPNERALVYRNPWFGAGRYGETIYHEGIFSANNQWLYKGHSYKAPPGLELSPMRITENTDQGLSRDVMAYGISNLLNNGYDVRLTVHDEAVAQIANDSRKEERLNRMIELLCTKEDWAKGLPLAADGYLSRRYKKG